MSALYVCELSLLTPLGAIPAMFKAAIDAGLNSYQLCALPGSKDDFVTFSAVPDDALNVSLPAPLPGMSRPQIRLLKLATFGLLDIKPKLPDVDLPLFLAGPDRYYQECGVNQAFINNLVKATGVKLNFEQSRYIGKGRAGFMEALNAALDYFESTGADYALVGGIDCYYDLRTLGILDQQRRLMGDNTVDGFVPAEGAGFLLVAAPHMVPNASSRHWFKLHRPALAHEPGNLMSQHVYRAETLSAVVDEVLGYAERDNRAVVRIISADNGESHYTKEFSIMHLRHQHRFVADCPIYKLAEYCGDLGAAFPVAAIALASVDIHSQNGMTLVTAGSDTGLRGAVIVSAIS